MAGDASKIWDARYSDMNLFYYKNMSNHRLVDILYNMKRQGDSQNPKFSPGEEICRCFHKGFTTNFSVRNNFGNGESIPVLAEVNSLLENTYESVKQARLYANTITDINLNDPTVTKLQNWVHDANESLMSKINEWTGHKNLSWDIFGGKMVSAINNVKTYQGTDFNIKVPDMHFTLHHHPQATVKQQLKTIMQYAVGEYRTIDSLASVCGIQLAPNNFRPSYGALGDETIMQGTLCLKCADGSCFTNIVISGIHVEVSVDRVKMPEGNLEVPLYCDVTLDLTHVGLPTRASLERIYNLN